MSETIDEQGAKVADTASEGGKRVRRVLVMKQFAAPEWIMKNVVAHGRGTHVKVGRVYGVAASAVRRTNDVNGQPVESIAIVGNFEGVAVNGGEVFSASTVYFPKAFAEQLAFALSVDGAGLLQVDTDIGVEATGKSIPYEWTTTSFIETEAAGVLLQLRNSRGSQAKLAAPAQPVVEDQPEHDDKGGKGGKAKAK